MASAPPQVPDWVVDLLDDGMQHADEGREVRVTFTHRASGLSLGAIAIYYGGGGDSVVTELFRDDFLVASHTSCRLLARLCSHHMRDVGRCGDCGLTTVADLRETIDTLYPDESEARAVIAMLGTALRTFWTPSKGDSREPD